MHIFMYAYKHVFNIDGVSLRTYEFNNSECWVIHILYSFVGRIYIKVFLDDEGFVHGISQILKTGKPNRF